MNKPFTELPNPTRTHRLSIVAVWNPIDPYDLQCENTSCKGEWIDEVSECPVCGRWMCDTCFGNHGATVYLSSTKALCNTVGSHGVNEETCCTDCSKLTPDERRAVMDLRLQLVQS